MARRCNRALCAFLLAFAVVTTTAPEVNAGNRFLNKAKRAYKNLRYDSVLPLLKKALRISKSDDEKIEIYGLMAEMHITYSRDAQAKKAYLQLLELDAAYALPEDSSPKLLAVFDEARAESGVAVVTSEANGPDPGGGQDSDPGGGDTALDAADTSAGGEGDSTDGSTDGSTGETSAETAGDTASGDGTTEVAAADVGAGSPGLGPTDPMRVDHVEKPTPIFGQWWFWTAVGVVVVGGAVAGTVLMTGGPDAPSGDFGPYNLP